MDFSVNAELGRVRAILGEIEGLLAREDERLGRVAPTVSGWSAEQHLAHLALSNELIFRNLKSLARGTGPLIRFGGGPGEKALEVLRSGVLPRGEAQSPRMVRPPARVQRDLLTQWLSDNRRDLEEVASQAEALAAFPGRIPHQLLGPLDAGEWARFCSMHSGHHLAIAREVLDRN